MSTNTDTGLVKALGTRDIFAAGVGLVVAASTLVSDFLGWFSGGWLFALALVASAILNLLLGLSAAELAVTYPRAGALYDYGAHTVPGGHAVKTMVGIFLAALFYIMFAFAGGGETTAGAAGAVGLFNGGDLEVWIVILTVLAVIPNLLGIEALARVELYVLFAMLGIRWFFGLAGFAGFSDAGAWSAGNIPSAAEGVTFLVLTGGFAFWSFVGIEFVAPLAEETRDVARSMPRGITYGIIAILATSLFMGLGVTGLGDLGSIGEDAPQLDVGIAMFGDTGRVLMALASVLATFASMTVVYAAMPRILYGLARSGHFLGPLSRPFSQLHPRFRTPWLGIFVTAIIYTWTAISFGAVVEQIFTAAYVWILLYAVYHILVIIGRYTDPNVDRPFKLPIAAPIVGLVFTLYVWYKAFEVDHGFFGPRALWIVGGSALVAILGYALRNVSGVEEEITEDVYVE